MPNQRFGPVDQYGNAVLAPEQPACPCLQFLEHKAHACIVALALDTVHSPATALKSDLPGLAETHAVDRLVGARGQGLCHSGVQVIGEPTLAHGPGVHVQGILRKAILLTQA
jgi:hypothetical protein